MNEQTRVDRPEGLAALEERLATDLAALNYPPANWVPETRHADGPVSDVVILGGGMCGLVAAFALQRAGIRNLRILDRSAAGCEGPWVTYARMETLRSPKQLTGPAFGIGALTFRQWFTAQWGEAAWEALDKIPRPMWMDYLRWYRYALALPVENGVEVIRVAPKDGLLELTLGGPAAREPVIRCRRLVMATGRDGTGAPNIPDFVTHLPRGDLWAHSSDEIDFASLNG
ncbi:MAG: NAD(P)/FAD-dependent oxidoreductase, partial [Pseudomonadota bacterium]